MRMRSPLRTSVPPIYIGISSSTARKALNVSCNSLRSEVPGAYDFTGSFLGTGVLKRSLVHNPDEPVTLEPVSSIFPLHFFSFEENGKLVLLTHVTPKIKLDGLSPMEILIKKVEVFENEFLEKYADSNITKVVIEEPLLQSNNVNTVATLLRFNGMICRSVYETLNVVPDFISSYDARKYAFPELMAIRVTDKEGKILSEKELKKKSPVLFGGYPKNVDKKLVVLPDCT
mgnify:CR=1 FL=1